MFSSRLSTPKPASLTPSPPMMRDSQLRVLESRIEETPASATAKGMYFESFLRMLKNAKIERPHKRRYLPFKDYPLTELMGLMLAATGELHPGMSPTDSLRQMGRLAFPTLVGSTVGKVLFSVAGRSWQAALPLTPKAYSLSVTGTTTLREMNDNSAVLELRDIWNFPDIYHVGVLEGAMQSYGVEGSVRADRHRRRCDVDLVLEWESP